MCERGSVCFLYYFPSFLLYQGYSSELRGSPQVCVCVKEREVKTGRERVWVCVRMNAMHLDSTRVLLDALGCCLIQIEFHMYSDALQVDFYMYCDVLQVDCHLYCDAFKSNFISFLTRNSSRLLFVFWRPSSRLLYVL